MKKYTDNISNLIKEEEEKNIKAALSPEHTKLISAVDKLFYEVYDPKDENRKKFPFLNAAYKQLQPVITPGDDAELQMKLWAENKYKAITDELLRMKKVLEEAKKNMK